MNLVETTVDKLKAKGGKPAPRAAPLFRRRQTCCKRRCITQSCTVQPMLWWNMRAKWNSDKAATCASALRLSALLLAR